MDLAEKWIEATEAQLLGKELNALQKDAIVKLYELSTDQPSEAVAEILKIIGLNPPTKILNCLGAGPLEELLVKHSQYVSELIEVARTNAGLRQCLGHVILAAGGPGAKILKRFSKEQ